jgi:16S rRNA A1518/A1519 N6-dimethyltransferase RsmA/KsgA/DIM1 with predicted DNA glycosylase/AP lyase activity
MIFILFWLLFFIITGSIVWSSYKNGISPMPTSPNVKKRLLESLPVKIEGIILELGAGWGTLAFSLADHYPHCTIIAYENSLIPFLFCYLRKCIRKQKNLVLLKKDFYDVSFSEASWIFCYLYPGAMKKLKEKFLKELKPGTHVVSHTFVIPGWIPFKIEKASDFYQTQIYYYQIK